MARADRAISNDSIINLMRVSTMDLKGTGHASTTIQESMDSYVTEEYDSEY